jgi:hypothetical protein
VVGVPLIVGAAAKAQSGANSTAKSERAKAIVGTRAKRARAFVVEKGMRVPIRVITTRRRTRRSSHPHTENSVPPDSFLVGHRMHEACRCDGLLAL